ncbi:plasmid maintenance system killer [Sphingomonas sp. Leaf357]|uniref:type II toxin-antitoxin system RelE/ParE family toxin n=1 Tax=Sphingomonas sp. Leaf357 TaxID=1736350 RepID=UPI0006F938D5|nr:type II toxin-antitoxin system RelE/ParE family toxin [Sphingomonas sp. Leaf357]KQS01782.1 plasmid maintenance system killer [Sphingomonas sp. Leaf357]
MEIASIRHRELEKFFLTGRSRGLDSRFVARIAKMLTFLVAIDAVEELRVPPNYGAHLLTGDRAGVWALTVSKNWRMTFSVDDEDAIVDLDLEDYH